MPKISVVVPVYKVEQYFNRCVKSIMNQTYKDFELILVDDGSPDNCPQMCDELSEKYNNVTVIHRENGGLSAARNTGIEWALENSDSEWITFIDSDDWIHPQYLESMLFANEKNDTQVCMGQFDFVSEYKVRTDGDAKDFVSVVRTEDAFTNEELDPNSACARLYKKSLFEDVRYPVGKLHEDRFTTYKVLFQSKNTSVVNYPLYYYFTNDDGIVHSKFNVRRLDNLEACENQLEYFKTIKNDEMYEYILKDYFHLLLYSLRQMKGNKEFKKHEKIVRNKLRMTIKIHEKRLKMNFSKDFNTYKYAYPLKAKIYNRLVLVNKG